MVQWAYGPFKAMSDERYSEAIRHFSFMGFQNQKIAFSLSWDASWCHFKELIL